jgi:hypothetical protein
MYRFFRDVISAGLILILLVSFSSAGPENPTKFTHVVIVTQENRAPDSLSHGLNKALGSDIADTGLNSNGETVALTAASLASPLCASGNTHYMLPDHLPNTGCLAEPSQTVTLINPKGEDNITAFPNRTKSQVYLKNTMV